MPTDMNSNNESSLALFVPPLTYTSNPSQDDLTPSSPTSTTDVSLSVNYIPSKFSEFRNRKERKGGSKFNHELDLPKQGGGLQAFKTSEARMAQGKRKLRWNKFKWILFITNALLMVFSIAALVVCLLSWFDIWEHADIIRVANSPELILSTIAACVGILTSLIGWAGILLNNRGFLAWYTLLTWITFAFLVIPGYITYKHRTFNLEGKINAQWSRDFATEDRLRIQNQLKCCGYFSPYVEATISQTCYSRSSLPGCKHPYLVFERSLLRRWFTAVFALVPIQIMIMVAGLLCSNHITYRFGKGMMPEAYRLNMNTMAVIMDNYANQLADHYGTNVASDVLKRARSTASVLGNSTSSNTARSSFESDNSAKPFALKSIPQKEQSLNLRPL